MLDLLAVPAAFGMGVTAAKHVADARASEADRAGMFGTSLCIASVAALIVTCGAALVLRHPASLRDQVARDALVWLVFLVPFIALYATTLGYLQGIGRIPRLAATQMGRSGLLLVVGTALVIPFGIKGWIGARAIGEALAFVIAISAIVRLRGARPQAQYLKPFLRFGGYATTTLALSTLLTGIDILCLDRFRGDPEEIAHYKVATLIFANALLLPDAFIQSRFSRMVAHGHDGVRTWQIFKRNLFYLTLIIAPATVVGYFVAPVISFVFGEQYAVSVGIFRWLLPAYFINSLAKLGANLVVGAGLMPNQLGIAAATLVTNLALNIALIPKYGIEGAVIATTGSFALRAVLLWWVLWRYRSGAARAADGTRAGGDPGDSGGVGPGESEGD